jgi:hypothetical protein
LTQRLALLAPPSTPHAPLPLTLLLEAPDVHDTVCALRPSTHPRSPHILSLTLPPHATPTQKNTVVLHVDDGGDVAKTVRYQRNHHVRMNAHPLRGGDLCCHTSRQSLSATVSCLCGTHTHIHPLCRHNGRRCHAQHALLCQHSLVLLIAFCYFGHACTTLTMPTVDRPTHAEAG